MTQKALLSYLFMFDPSETWQHRHQFEGDLFKFFDEKGFVGYVMPYIEGGGGPRIICVDKKEEVVLEKILEEVGPQKKLEKLKKDFKEPKRAK